MFTCGLLQEMLCHHESLWKEGDRMYLWLNLTAAWSKRTRAEERSCKGKNLEREIAFECFWRGYLRVISCWALFKSFFSVIFLLDQDEGCSRQRKKNFAVIHGWDESTKAKSLSSHSDFRVWTTGQRTRVRVCSCVWSFHAVFAKTQRHPHHVGATPFERKERIHLWSRQQSPERQVFISIPDKSLNKNKRFGYSSKEAEKIYNPSGRSLSSISHEDLTVFSCEAGKGVLFFYCSSDRRGLGFCVELWECGSRRHSVDTQNKVGLDKLKVLHNGRIVEVCWQFGSFLIGRGRKAAAVGLSQVSLCLFFKGTHPSF